ncbi:Cilia- and flagella-associated protein 221 [Merluccius polli]|uniref:Cilia- and flagella-associated protein 221 n=1 Tax=Merluccius polli TaxID=89951 RepID=A0AA47MKF9_MERPO|nr:Cilia- and flagella-associated protein 221 [Merluccius polli]
MAVAHLGFSERSLRRGSPVPLGQLVEDTRTPRAFAAPHHLLCSKIYTRLKSNSQIQAEPAALHFNGFVLGKDYQKVLKLINISSEVMNIHIIPTQTKYFQTTYTKKVCPVWSVPLTGRITPSKDEDVFVNRKKVHSINTQIVFDATFYILDAAKWPGSTHDSRILMESGLRQDVALDTLSHSTTGSTVKSTQKYTTYCGERNWADQTSISCPARRNTPQPREGKYSDHCMCHSPQPRCQFLLDEIKESEDDTDVCVVDHPSFAPHMDSGVLETYFRIPKVNWKRQPKPTGPNGRLSVNYCGTLGSKTITNFVLCDVLSRQFFVQTTGTFLSGSCKERDWAEGVESCYPPEILSSRRPVLRAPRSGGRSGRSIYRLIPGLAYTVKIHFCPDEWRYFYDCIRVHCEGEENLLIPVHAYSVIDDLRVPPHIHLPSVPLGHSVSHSLPLHCSCPVDFEFQVHVVQAHPAFEVQPLAGLIPANGEVAITVTFRPLQYGTSQLTIQLVVSQFSTKPFLCTFTGSSAPHLPTSALEGKRTGGGVLVNDYRTSSPLVPPVLKSKRTYSKKADKTKTGGSKAATKPPSPAADVCTPAGVAKMLIKDGDKLSSKDLRGAISCDSLVGLKSRQVKEAFFMKKVQHDVREERANHLRWQQHLGKTPVSKQSKRQILEEREIAVHEYMVKRDDGDQDKNVFMSGPPTLSSRRVLRDARQVAEGAPCFQFYCGPQLLARLQALRLFQQAARKVVIRCRMNRRLACLRKMAAGVRKPSHHNQEQGFYFLISTSLGIRGNHVVPVVQHHVVFLCCVLFILVRFEFSQS